MLMLNDDLCVERPKSWRVTKTASNSFQMCSRALLLDFFHLSKLSLSLSFSWLNCSKYAWLFRSVLFLKTLCDAFSAKTVTKGGSRATFCQTLTFPPIHLKSAQKWIFALLNNVMRPGDVVLTIFKLWKGEEMSRHEVNKRKYWLGIVVKFLTEKLV